MTAAATTSIALARRPSPAPTAFLAPPVRPVPPPCTLHLLDGENILGGDVSPGRLVLLTQVYEHLIGVGDEDDVIAGFCPQTAGHARGVIDSWARVVVGESGPDSAEKAVLAAVDPERTVARYDRIVIASGDHAFSQFAATLRALGARVVVAAPRRAIATSLYLACTDDLLLTVPAA